METGLQLNESANEGAVQGQGVGSTAPNYGKDVPLYNEMRSTTPSTAAFWKVFVAGLAARYLFRGASGIVFQEAVDAGGWRNTILNTLSKPGRWLQEKKYFSQIPLPELNAAGYASSLWLGSSYISYSYSQAVRNDIQTVFDDVVAYEMGKPADQVTFSDIKKSQNNIIKATLSNYNTKLWSRLGTDLLFLIPAALRSEKVTDLMLGVKGAQLYWETKKHTRTLFTEITEIVATKLSTNAMAQPITTGDILNLYQHYADKYQPENKFDRGTGTGVTWAQSQPIFERISALMNTTYAYKHKAILDPSTGQPVQQTNFPLPKFIYMLGHNLIDIKNPEKTLAMIEVANRYGIPSVRDMATMLGEGIPLPEVMARYPLPVHASAATIPVASKPQMESAPPLLDAVAAVPSPSADTAPASRVESGSVQQYPKLSAANAPEYAMAASGA